ncbi:MAG: hypothetical protein K2Q25_01870 [Mycobacteriaceae bacterium]|nr:hypothetical protein [Mycobacteriaceae bacterium]
MAAVGYRAPWDRREMVLAGLFAEVLGLPQLGIDHSFFDAGGDWLSAAQLVQRIQARLGIEIEVQALSKTPTVAGLSAWLGPQIAHRTRRVLAVRERPSHIPLSFAQAYWCEWFVDQLQGPTRGLVTADVAVRMTGHLDADALAAAVRDMVVRHENLRTVFPRVGGVPEQVVLPAEQIDFSCGIVTATTWSADRLQDAIDAVIEERFVLVDEIPLRARLFRVAEDEHVLVLVIHHIVMDGWSVIPLFRDLGRAYASRRAGQAPSWAEPAVQYADYTLWQGEFLGDPADSRSVLGAQLAYWEQALAGMPARLALPTDRPYPLVADQRGDCVEVVWPVELHQRMVRLAREHTATTFTVFQAGLTALFSRLCRTTDVVYGITTSGRSDIAFDDLVGLFIDELVMRIEISGDPTFVELLAVVRARNLAGYQHKDVPFVALCDRLNPVRSLAQHPLFQVNLVWRPAAQANNCDADPSWGDLQITWLYANNVAAALMDLEFLFDECWAAGGEPAGIRGVVDFRTDVFDAASITLLVERLEQVLVALKADPSRRLSSIDGMVA